MTSEAREHLLESARKEIEEFGILGFRISRVANQANCSITQIYRYFGNRNGLVSRALSDLYEEILDSALDSAESYIRSFETMTIENVLSIFTGPREMAQMAMMPVRLQILAVASTIPELEDLLCETTEKQFARWLQLIDEVRTKLPSGVEIDERAITIDLVMLMPYYARLLGANAVATDDYVAWIRHKLFSHQ